MTRTKRDEAAGLRLGFSWIGALGVILVLAGLVGLFSTAFATLTSMLLFGRLLLTGGVVGLLHAVQARGTNFFWLGVVAALNIAAGVDIIRRPEAGAEALAVSGALLFLADGVFQVVSDRLASRKKPGEPGVKRVQPE